MRYLALLLLSFSVETQAQILRFDQLYGQDNRTEFSKAKASHKKLAESTAALIVHSFLVKKGNKYTIDAPDLEAMDGVCASEKFRQQPSASICSGTLIAPDLILTASHCYNNQAVCKNASWAFGYHDSRIGKYSLKEKDIYRCREIVYHSFDLDNGHDFAIVKLDRPVKNRTPVTLRPEGKPSLNTPLVLIGHPRGLPTKIADDAWITALQNNFFMTNIDAYTGTSGSGVFNADTEFLEGVLSFGKEDYKEDKANDCMLSQVYDMQDGGEAVMMIDPVREFLKTYESSRP